MNSLRTLALTTLILVSGCGPSSTPNSNLSVEERLKNLEAEIVKLGQRVGTTGSTPAASPSASATANSSNGLSATLPASSASPASTDPSTVKEIRVVPDTIKVAVGGSAKIDGLLIMGNDQPSVVSNFNLLSPALSDATVASIDSSGKVTGLKAGNAVLTLKVGAITKTVIILVEAGTASPSPTPSPSASATASASATPSPTPTPGSDVKSISVDPVSYNLKVNAVASVTTILVTKQDDTQGFLNADARTNVTYSSSNTSIAAVDSSGVITGKAVGTATITITYKGVSTTAPVTVTAN